jgi:hypothetical protein
MCQDFLVIQCVIYYKLLKSQAGGCERNGTCIKILSIQQTQTVHIFSALNQHYETDTRKVSPGTVVLVGRRVT